ncbi:hypothetical protein [Streptomyces sp. NPDC055607]
MTTRARQASRHRLDLVISRLDNIAAGASDPLTPGEAGHYAAIIRAHWSEAARTARDLYELTGWRRAATKRLTAANQAIREVEQERDTARTALTQVLALAADIDTPTWRAPGSEVAARIRLACQTTTKEPS